MEDDVEDDHGDQHNAGSRHLIMQVGTGCLPEAKQTHGKQCVSSESVTIRGHIKEFQAVMKVRIATVTMALEHSWE
ncbi:MAG: hypothetical protein ACLVH0_04420 [Coprococcus eutactus]